MYLFLRTQSTAAHRQNQNSIACKERKFRKDFIRNVICSLTICYFPEWICYFIFHYLVLAYYWFFYEKFNVTNIYLKYFSITAKQKNMRTTLLSLASIVVVFFTSCSTSNYVQSSAGTDDMYAGNSHNGLELVTPKSSSTPQPSTTSSSNEGN